MKILVFGANSTVAKELQKIWAQNGHEMTLIGRDSDVLKRIASDLVVRGARSVKVVQKDLMEFDDADDFVRSIWNVGNGYDLVFMAHGVLGSQQDDLKAAEDTIKIIEANFLSHVSFLTPIANLMEESRNGAIAVITSVAGDRGKQSNYIYCSAKAGKIAFLSGLRNRLFPSNVAVTEIRMGFVDTKMTENFEKGALWASPEKVAVAIDSAIQNRKDIVYIPKIWFFIMSIIKSIPEVLFKRLKL